MTLAELPPEVRAAVVERFWAKVPVADESECWIWQGVIVPPQGYGRLTAQRTNYYAHRVSWELANGRPVPDGLYVCHRCDVRRCVNPAHLFIGTHQDNMADARVKGRLAQPQKTHCKHGHALSGDNVYIHLRDGRPKRHCRACQREARRRRNKRLKAERSGDRG